MVLQVRRHLTTLTNTCFYFHVLLLTFLQTLVAHLADTRTLLQRNNEPYLVSLDLLRFDLHGREQTLFPETLDGFGDLVTRHFYLIAYSKTGESYQHKILVAIRSLHFDVGYLVGLTRHTVLDVLRLQRPQDKGQKTKDQYIKYSLHFQLLTFNFLLAHLFCQIFFRVSDSPQWPCRTLPL